MVESDVLIIRTIFILFLLALNIGLLHYLTASKKILLKRYLIVLLVVWIVLKVVLYSYKDWILAAFHLSIFFTLVIGLVIYIGTSIKNRHK